ncbi:hypothetical protein [Streptomyces yanii]|uniref:Uncharacterized protein n=1 Tax=Streptomyces yanii TaxID=78510 RepID=A0ABV5REF7_9ACTN
MAAGGVSAPGVAAAREQQLAQDAVERGWPREVERHSAIADRIRSLLADLGESTEPSPDDHC